MQKSEKALSIPRLFLPYFSKDLSREESLDKVLRTCLNLFVFFIFFLFLLSRYCECICNFKSLLYTVRFECISLLLSKSISFFFFQQSVERFKHNFFVGWTK